MENKTKYKNSRYYDKLYKNSLVYNLPNIKKSPYYNVWKTILKYATKRYEIIDFGCGAGQFAQLCFANGRKYMVGYDFSEEAINMAKKNNPDNADKFILQDLNNRDIYKTEYENLMSIFCEVLEHIPNDIQLLSYLPELTDVIITVPNYDSESHVRFFNNLENAIQYYEKIMFIKNTEIIKMQKENEIYILTGQRKWDIM